MELFKQSNKLKSNRAQAAKPRKAESKIKDKLNQKLKFLDNEDNVDSGLFKASPANNRYRREILEDNKVVKKQVLAQNQTTSTKAMETMHSPYNHLSSQGQSNRAEHKPHEQINKSHKLQQEIPKLPADEKEDKSEKARMKQINNIQSTIHSMNLKQKTRYNISDNLQTLECIGKGGQGSVFRVLDPVTKKIYAKKVVQKKKDSKTFDYKAINELTVLLIIMMADDPALLQIHSIEYEVGEKYSILMEFGQGDLSAYSKFREKNGLLWKLNEVLNIGTQIVDQIERLRKIGIYHRDVKPHNVIICDGRLKLTDFSLSRHCKKGDVQHINPCGTRGYWAPEVEAAYSINKRIEYNLFEADIYSVGKTLEAITSWSPIRVSIEFTETISSLCVKRDPKVFKRGLYENSEWKDYINDFIGFYMSDHISKLNIKIAKKSIEVMWENNMFKECKEWICIILKTKVDNDNKAFVSALWSLLGQLHEKECEFTHALNCYLQTLALKLEVFGPLNKEIVKSYQQLAGVYHKLGLIDQALESYFSALNIRNSLGGIDQLEVSKYYQIIGNLFINSGNIEKAIEFLFKALQLRTEILGPQHKEIASLQIHLGHVYYRSGKFDEALLYYQRALEIKSSIFGDFHPELAGCYTNIANIEYITGRHKPALDLYLKALEIKRTCSSEPTADLADLYNNIGNSYQKLGLYDDSLKNYALSLSMRISLFGDSHIIVAGSYQNIGISYDLLGKKEEALANFLASLEIRRKNLDSNHPEILKSCNVIAGIYHAMEEFDLAYYYYSCALEIQTKTTNLNDLEVAETYFNLGSVLSHKNCESAVESFEKAIEIRKLHSNQDERISILNDKISELMFKKQCENNFQFDFIDYTRLIDRY